MQQVLASLVLFGIIIAACLGARRVARKSQAMRMRLLVSGCIGLAVGAVCIFWLPRRIPETPGSPATLVGVALLWVLGSVFVLYSVPVLIGAALARPPADDDHPRP